MTAVLGPLATFAEPHCYDLCEQHTRRLIPPRGWELVKLDTDLESLKPSSDDLDALADAVREAAGAIPGNHPVQATGRRGHLRIVRDAD